MKSKLSLMMIIILITALLLPEVVLSRQEDIVEPTGLPKKNKALYLGWGGYVDTKAAFSRFFGADHTLMGWFMPQYPHAAVGPIFAVNGTGTYWIGQDDYRIGDGGPRQNSNNDTVWEKGRPAFSIQVGTQKRTYLLNQLIAGKWVHIAVVRKNNKFELYLNGLHQVPVLVSSISKENHTWNFEQEMTVSANSTDLPQGTLRLGRIMPDRSKSEQAYGLLDDIALFGKALNSVEINEIMLKKRLSGKEAGLLVGWCFDQPGPNDWKLPPKLDSWWQDVPRVYRVEVTTDRASEQDKTQFDNSIIIGNASKPLRLPFRDGDVWYVVQGYDDAGYSHNGYAAFSYDFKRVESKDGEKLKHPEGTAYTPVYAAAPAKAEYYTKLIGGSESVRLKLDENEYMAYLHVATATLNPKFTGGNCSSTQPVECYIPVPQATIQQDEIVAEVFDWDNKTHLHVSTGNGVSGTFPVAFDDYYVSTDGKTWTKVFRGHPKAGQYIKRAGNPKPPKTVNLQCSTSNATVLQKKINGETMFEHKAYVSITTGSSSVPAGAIIKYSVNGHSPNLYKVAGPSVIPPLTTRGLGWYKILLDEKENWPGGCSASYISQ
jgi:hypothetical protein